MSEGGPRWKTAVGFVVAVAVLAVPVTVWAAARVFGERDYGVDRQAFQWRKDASSTSSTEWHRLPLTGTGSANAQPEAHPLAFVARGPMSVTLSADFKGAPVQVRIVERKTVLRPGRASFRPAGRDTSKSFTFVSDGTSRARCRLLFVEWRSPTGKKVTFRRGDLVVTYNRPESTEARCPNA